MSPSTSELVPDIKALRRLTKSIAMLDAILMPEWQYRYYSYNANWSAGEEMASMRDGRGDDWFLLFAPCGAALKGFAHESPLARNIALAARIPQVVPAEFASFLSEPAFSMNRATFCLWRSFTDRDWNVVSAGDRLSATHDGSVELLQILDYSPQTYRAWAEDYYERDVSLVAVQAIYEHRPLNADLLAALNPDLSLADVAADAKEIAYPEISRG
jgi:hypothetical protein